jgi:proteasome accessory factor B
VRRIERLINLIAALLDTTRPLSAEDIRRDVAGYDQANHEAFRRAFERDKEALRSMGIPIELRQTEVDPFSDQLDGYIIPKDLYYLPEIDLEPDEVAALHVAGEAILGGSEHAEEGLLKLSMGEASSPWSTPRVALGTDIAAEAPALGPLYGALLERVPVTFTYQPARGDSRVRDVEPYGLVHRRGDWYVVGRAPDRDAVRSFKVSRITSAVKRGEGTYEIPEGFDPASHLTGEGFEIGDEPTTATLRFAAKLAWWPEQNMPEAPRSEGPDGSVDVQVPVGNEQALVSWVLGFGDEVEIMSPGSARAAMSAHLAPLLGAR